MDANDVFVYHKREKKRRRRRRRGRRRREREQYRIYIVSPQVFRNCARLGAALLGGWLGTSSHQTLLPFNLATSVSSKKT